jgi:NADH-quinone oxidoreductase subunit E
MAFTFTAVERLEIERILARYPEPMSATIPLLHLAQGRLGWVSPEVVDEVARLLELPRIHVADVVSFYSMFQRKPVGRHRISVCRTLSCHVLGGKDILEYLRARLELGEAHSGTDPRGLFTLEEVECLAACGTGPVLLVNGVYHEGMTLASVKSLLDHLEAGGGNDAPASAAATTTSRTALEDSPATESLPESDLSAATGREN